MSPYHLITTFLHCTSQSFLVAWIGGATANANPELTSFSCLKTSILLFSPFLVRAAFLEKSLQALCVYKSVMFYGYDDLKKRVMMQIFCQM